MEKNQSLQLVENELKSLKETLKSTYKTLKSAKGNESHDMLTKQFNGIYSSIQKVHQESSKLDEEKIWEKILNHTDMNTFDAFEKQTNEQFIYITQLLRGTLQGVKTFNEKIA